MKARKLKLSALLIAGTLILALGSGCGGKRVGPLVDPADQPTEKPPAQEEPAPAPSTQPSTPPTTSQPNVPTVPNNPAAQLQAQSEIVKNGSFLGMGDLVVKVTVSNPSQYALSGEVTVTFTKSGKATSHVENQRLSLQPNETVSRYFEKSGISTWSLDGATVTVKTDAPLANAGSYSQY